MCTYGDHIILSKSDHVQISWCKGCKTYSLVYKTSCLSFTQKEFNQFKIVLDSLEEADFNYNFLGEPHALIKNQYAFMGVCLKAEDVLFLKEAMYEASTMKEVFGIIYQ